MQSSLILQGPVSARILRYGQQTIYIFGDNHSDKQTYCPEAVSIVDFLEEWLTIESKSQNLVDVYIEQIYTKDKRPSNSLAGYNNYITETMEMLSSCLHVDKTNCRFGPDVRVHYFDIRTVEIATGRKSALLIMALSNMAVIALNTINAYRETPTTYRREVMCAWMLDVCLASDKIVNNIDEYIDIELLSINYLEDVFNFPVFSGADYVMKGFAQAVEKELKLLNKGSMSRTAAELNKLTRKEKDNIYAFCLELIDRYKKHYDYALLNDLYRFEQEGIGNLEELESRFRKNKTVLIYLSIPIVDAYTLARVTYFNDSSKIILYAGDSHCTNYTDYFLKYLQADLIEEANVLGQRCIESRLLLDEVGRY